MPFPGEMLQPDTVPVRPIDYAQVATMDPFGMWADWQELPTLNYRRDTHLVRGLISKAVRIAEASPPGSPEEAAARLRDLDFPIGSYLGHAVMGLELDSLASVPGLREELVRDSRMTGQQPRGGATLYSIGNSRNTDPGLQDTLGFELTYTGDQRERTFIENLRVSAEALRAAEHRLSNIVLVGDEDMRPTDDTELETALLQTSEAFTTMGKASLDTFSKLPIPWFNANIQLWFKAMDFGTPGNPILVNGGSGAHLAPGIDYMLWGMDLKDYSPSEEFSDFPEYERYAANTLPYEDLYSRMRLRTFAGNNSTSILRHIADRYEPGSPVRRAAQDMLASQRMFRFPHGAGAKTALHKRETGHQVGGGGFDEKALDGLKTKSQEWAAKLGGYKGRIAR